MIWRRRCRLSCAGLLQVCVGAEAEDNFHMVEIEGLTYDGKSTKVPLAVLKPSIMPSVSARHEGCGFVTFGSCQMTFVLEAVAKKKTRPLCDSVIVLFLTAVSTFYHLSRLR